MPAAMNHALCAQQHQHIPSCVCMQICSILVGQHVTLDVSCFKSMAALNISQAKALATMATLPLCSDQLLLMLGTTYYAALTLLLQHCFLAVHCVLQCII